MDKRTNERVQALVALSTHLDEKMDKLLTKVDEKTAFICDRMDTSLGALLARTSQLEEKIDALQYWRW